MEDFTSSVHRTRVVARLGIWLGFALLICFLTGLVSHVHQHPITWLPIQPSPAWAYRVSQGLHVVTGVACVPLLLAKMYAAFPRLFERPMVGSPLRLLERGSIAVLVASSLLQVSTGAANIAQWYVFGFGFTQVHFALAWVSIGALALNRTADVAGIPTWVSGSGTWQRWSGGAICLSWAWSRRNARAPTGVRPCLRRRHSTRTRCCTDDQRKENDARPWLPGADHRAEPARSPPDQMGQGNDGVIMKSIGTTRDRAGLGPMVRLQIGIGAAGVAIGLAGACAFAGWRPGPGLVKSLYVARRRRRRT